MKTKRQTLKSAIRALIADMPPGPVNVYAFEMWRDDCGWSVNDSWRIASSVDPEDVPAIARGRWEVFKANYAPRARVSSLSDIGYDQEVGIEIEAEGMAFLSVRPAK